jgi:hypothetical protein
MEPEGSLLHLHVSEDITPIGIKVTVNVDWVGMGKRQSITWTSRGLFVTATLYCHSYSF